MKRIKLIIIFSFLVLKITAQNKLFISYEVSPTLSYRCYKLIDYSQGNSIFPSGKVYYDQFNHLYDSIESSQYGFMVAFNLGYYITEKFSIQTGFEYKCIGVKYELAPHLGSSSNNGTTQYIFGSSADFVVNSKYHYIGIPVRFQYNVYSFNRFNIGLILGSTIDFLISHEGSELNTYPSTSQFANASDYSKATININGGINFSYIINNKWDIYIIPQFTKYLTSNAKINLYTSNDLFLKINQYNYFGDLKLGLRWKI